MKIKSNWIALTIAIVALVTVGALAIRTTANTIIPAKEKILTVGTNTPFPPFEDRKGDEVFGFDIDLVQMLAKDTGKTLEVKDFQDFYALLPSLVAGKLDAVISAVTITPERAEIVDFSNVYFTTSQGILARKGAIFAITNTEQFANYKVGYQQGTTSETWVKENLLKSTSVSVGELGLGLQYLRLGEIDVLIVDKPVADAFAKQNKDIAVVGEIKTGESYGIAVQKGDPNHLLPAFNKLLTKPEYQDLITKWFGGQK